MNFLRIFYETLPQGEVTFSSRALTSEEVHLLYMHTDKGTTVNTPDDREFTLAEIRNAVESKNNKKAPGEDGKTGEIFKHSKPFQNT
jgi:hypothetical protein